LAKPHAVCEVELLTQGPVEFGDREHATGKVRELCELGHEPVLTAVVKLRLRENVAGPMIAEATIDMNGVAIRAHASGDTMTEAIDRLDDRLGRRLRRHRSVSRTADTTANRSRRGVIPATPRSHATSGRWSATSR
jgi:ribosomal subunit interface protein